MLGLTQHYSTRSDNVTDIIRSRDNRHGGAEHLLCWVNQWCHSDEGHTDQRNQSLKDIVLTGIGRQQFKIIIVTDIMWIKDNSHWEICYLQVSVPDNLFNGRTEKTEFIAADF